MENGENNLALDYDLYSYDGTKGYSKSMSNDDVTVRSANHILFPFLSSNTKPGYEPSDLFQ
jgi:hypothetical protein